jgi:hypothetical protein
MELSCSADYLTNAKVIKFSFLSLILPLSSGAATNQRSATGKITTAEVRAVIGEAQFDKFQQLGASCPRFASKSN